MNSSEQAEVLQHMEKFGDVLNNLTHNLLLRLLSGKKLEVNPLLNTDRMMGMLSRSVKVDPGDVLQKQLSFMEKQLNLWQNAAKAMTGGDFDSIVEEAKGDGRFVDEEWKQNPFFNFIKQSYLLNAELLQQTVDSLEFKDNKLSQQLKFYTRQYINSLSPSNYILTNPEICREILETKGDNLAKGIDNFIRDLESSPFEALKVNQVDVNAFTVGETLAYTPGKVIYENELIQLIQYSPATEQVYQVPLLIIPPFINKYYILDLDEKKSLVRWLVDQGYSVFMVSWVNPDAELAVKTIEDYMRDGVIAAVDVVESVTEESKINVVGYCVGGTLLGITQSYMQSHKDYRIKTLTFLTTLFDFSEPGELGNYISEQSLPLIEQFTNNKGYFDGRVLSVSFSLLRENNLFWSFFVNNYLKGKDSIPFDILYWNSDSTNIPRDIFLYYLHNMYVENNLIKDGGIEVAGTPIHLGDINVPCYFLATASDHIVLWSAAYRSARCVSGKVRFVLAGSGHVAGVVNPAEKGKYPYWINSEMPESHQEWQLGATQKDSSWWKDWDRWLKSRSGGKVAGREPGTEKFPVIDEAPGRYVKVRLEKSLEE